MDEKQIEEIHQIIENEYVKSVYQSIVSLKCGEVFAYEALSRVTKAQCSMSIGEVFQTASQADCLWEEKQHSLYKAYSEPWEWHSYWELIPNQVYSTKVRLFCPLV